MPTTLPTAPSIQIKTLAAIRTFWEKATIAHQYAHWPDDKKIPERQSRHFYDLYQLLQSDLRNAAFNEAELLHEVASHKNIYFRASWANYDAARKGQLRLIPSRTVQNVLKSDYEKMQDMFYASPVAWKSIIQVIAAFEAEFNQE